eukprot:8358750-Alexandrium_andersonii.AAC.1
MLPRAHRKLSETPGNSHGPPQLSRALRSPTEAQACCSSCLRACRRHAPTADCRYESGLGVAIGVSWVVRDQKMALGGISSRG